MSTLDAFANVQARWARHVVESLVLAGVRNVVASPGSRNTPLLAALAACESVTTTSVIDERSAAFFALGQARVTQRASVLICTSGTAAAHYLPAIVEASYAGLPLIILSADRPPELQDCGAPQTITQANLYGQFVRWSCDLGVADGSPLSLRALRRKVLQAVDLSVGPRPGPVHLNFPARLPLEPPSDSHERFAPVPSFSATAPRQLPSPRDVEHLARACEQEAHGVIVCGPCLRGQRPDRATLSLLAQRTGYPVYCELTSQLLSDPPYGDAPLLGAFDLFVRAPAWQELAPRIVLQLGVPPTSSAWNQWLALNPDVGLHVVAPHAWPDPANIASTMIRSDVALCVEALAQRLAERRPERQWAARHAALDAAARTRVEAHLVATPHSEGAVVARVLSTLPSGTELLLGNSLPLRDADWFRPPTLGSIRVHSQRGANGIDGLIAGATGIAATSPEAPTVALLGDVTALHDVGSLAIAATLRSTLVLVVLNNGGGRIFDTLPVARDRNAEELGPWRTPHGRDLCAIATAFGLHAEKVNDADTMAASLRAALERKGCTLIDAQVEPPSLDWLDSWRRLDLS